MSLRLALGHKALANKKYNETISMVPPEEPLSPEGQRVREGTGPGGHPQLVHQPEHSRKRSNLMGDTTMVEEAAAALEWEAEEAQNLQDSDDDEVRQATAHGHYHQQQYQLLNQHNCSISKTPSISLSSNSSTPIQQLLAVHNSASSSSSASSSVETVLATADMPTTLSGSFTNNNTPSHGHHGHGGNSSLLAHLCPGTPELPTFLEEKEGLYREHSATIAAAAVASASPSSSLLDGEIGSSGMSESPSPSQRAAISLLYGLERVSSSSSSSLRAGGGEEGGLVMGVTRGGEEKEEDLEEGGGARQQQQEEAGEEQQKDEQTETSQVIKHILAHHYISDKPELKRYDSADAVLEEARGPPHHHHGRRKSSPVSILSSHLKSELQIDGEPASITAVPTVLQQPPRTQTSRRRSSSVVELPAVLMEVSSPTHTDVHTDTDRQTHTHVAVDSGDRMDSEEMPDIPRLPRPRLAHFDSGDYFKEKEKKEKEKEQGKKEAGVGKGGSGGSGGAAGGGYKTAAAFLLQKGERSRGHRG